MNKNQKQRKNKKGVVKLEKNIIENIYQSKYEELDEKIIKKIKENKNKFSKINEIEIKDLKTKKQIEEQIKNIEENNNIKNAIIKEEMYKQGLKDGINLIILCQNQQKNKNTKTIEIPKKKSIFLAKSLANLSVV